MATNHFRRSFNHTPGFNSTRVASARLKWAAEPKRSEATCKTAIATPNPITPQPLLAMTAAVAGPRCAEWDVILARRDQRHLELTERCKKGTQAKKAMALTINPPASERVEHAHDHSEGNPNGNCGQATDQQTMTLPAAPNRGPETRDYCSRNLPRLCRRRAQRADEGRAQTAMRLLIAACNWAEASRGMGTPDTTRRRL